MSLRRGSKRQLASTGEDQPASKLQKPEEATGQTSKLTEEALGQLTRKERERFTSVSHSVHVERYLNWKGDKTSLNRLERLQSSSQPCANGAYFRRWRATRCLLLYLRGRTRPDPMLHVPSILPFFLHEKPQESSRQGMVVSILHASRLEQAASRGHVALRRLDINGRRDTRYAGFVDRGRVGKELYRATHRYKCCSTICTDDAHIQRIWTSETPVSSSNQVYGPLKHALGFEYG